MRQSTKSIIIEYVGFMRMMQLWFHAAHHLTRGSSFAGDHVNLYGKIYENISGQIDGAIEKAVGLFGEDFGCPIVITGRALKIMTEYPSPTELNAASIAAVGLMIEKDWLRFSKNFYDSLKQDGKMTLGMDDFIMANANAHESHVYLLQQRVRESLR